MAWMEGAKRARLTKNFSARCCHKRAIILHTAASSADGGRTFRYWNRDGNAGASSHFYVDYDGTIWQFVDTDFKAWTSGAANDYSIGIETQGFGDEEWTKAQTVALAKIIAWAYRNHDIPLRLMRSSAWGEDGVGWHSLGVPASRWQKARRMSQTGGQLWSKAVGKECPGTERIRQIPMIVQEAIAIINGKKDEEDELNEQEKRQLAEVHVMLKKLEPRLNNTANGVGHILDTLHAVKEFVFKGDFLGDKNALGLRNWLVRVRRWIEPPTGTDPNEPKDAPWNRWAPWRETVKPENLGEANTREDPKPGFLKSLLGGGGQE